MAQIERTGSVSFGDASLNVWEDDFPCRSNYQDQRKWETAFKRQVFSRIVQQLNRLGWKCAVPDEKISRYGLSFARNFRYCTKGDLQADLGISGRHIEFKMFQNVNAPDRPDYGGRYQYDKEKHMPYVMRLEMERTRRRIRDYLCNVFSGYEFNSDKSAGRTGKVGPNNLTAMEWLEGCYKTSCHFKGDLTKYEIQDFNKKSADGAMLEHGQRVYFFDYHGRINTGIAFYNINNMWWVITGKYGHNNKSCSELYDKIPEKFRIKRNAKQRRQRLESELAKAIKAMDFERAAILRDIVFPKVDLFLVWHKEHELFHRPGFMGYTSNEIDAGKFTEDEVKSFSGDDRNEVRRIEAA